MKCLVEEPIINGQSMVGEISEEKCLVYWDRDLLGGKCSICGEPFDRKPKLLGVGDALYSGKIVRTYTEGSVIPVTVVVSFFYHLSYCNYEQSL